MSKSILIADSGSTKTDWMFIDDKNKRQIFQTHGINPYIMEDDFISNIIENELIPQLKTTEIDSIFYYGCSCSTEVNCQKIERLIKKFLYQSTIVVEHDMLGAARAVCGHDAGIACILGTGSNTCVYDGKNIIDELTNLGFLAGDEGSGSYLGRLLLKSYCYRYLPEDLVQDFKNTFKLDPKQIVVKLYATKTPNSFVASFVPFISKHKEHPFMQKIIHESFTDFFEKNILYLKGAKQYDLYFVGSIAHHFQKELEQIAYKFNFNINNIIKKPIDNLVDYHLL